MIAIEESPCIKSLAEIMNVLRRTNQYEQVLHLVVDRIARIYKCQTVAVIVIDSSEYLHVENSYGLSATFCKAFRQRIATGAIGELIWTNKPIILSESTASKELARELKLEKPFSSCIAVPIAIDFRPIGYLYADSKDANVFSENDIEVFQIFAALCGLAINKARLYEDNLRLEKIDSETGLDKYGEFIKKVEQNLQRAKNFDETFAIILGDIDNYKYIVNTYGYETSREFLNNFGKLLRSKIRDVDAAGRYGLDEVVVLRAMADLNEAVTFAQNLREMIEKTAFTAHSFHSTLSMGVAVYPINGMTARELFLTARRALFEAQRAGRNKVCYFKADWYSRGSVIST